jgi:hypothetical protein
MSTSRSSRLRTPMSTSRQWTIHSISTTHRISTAVQSMPFLSRSLLMTSLNPDRCPVPCCRFSQQKLPMTHRIRPRFQSMLPFLSQYKLLMTSSNLTAVQSYAAVSSAEATMTTELLSSPCALLSKSLAHDRTAIQSMLNPSASDRRPVQ